MTTSTMDHGTADEYSSDPHLMNVRVLPYRTVMQVGTGGLVYRSGRSNTMPCSGCTIMRSSTNHRCGTATSSPPISAANASTSTASSTDRSSPDSGHSGEPTPDTVSFGKVNCGGDR